MTSINTRQVYAALGAALGRKLNNNDPSMVETVKVIDLDQPITTLALLRAHLLRIVLAAVTPVVLACHWVGASLGHGWFLCQIFCYVVRQQAELARQRRVSAWYGGWCQLSAQASAVPTALRAMCVVEPHGLRHYQLSLPITNVSSYAYVGTIAPYGVAPPAQAPKPYLDGDKQLVVPTAQELKHVEVLHERYNHALDAHVASETARLAREFAQIVTWASLQPTTAIYLYERSGCVTPDTLCNVLTIEYAKFIARCSTPEFDELAQLMPDITVCGHGTTRSANLRASLAVPGDGARSLTVTLLRCYDVAGECDVTTVCAPQSGAHGFSWEGNASCFHHHPRFSFALFAESLFLYAVSSC
ncbi:hypothetical protein DICA4_F08988 [Diutina catenulata]